MIFSMFEASIVDEFLHGSYGSQPHRCLLKIHFIVIVITFAGLQFEPVQSWTIMY